MGLGFRIRVEELEGLGFRKGSGLGLRFRVWRFSVTLSSLPELYGLGTKVGAFRGLDLRVEV